MTFERSFLEERKKLRKNMTNTIPIVDRETKGSIERAKPKAIPIKKQRLNRIIVR